MHEAQELHYLTISELGKRFRDKRLSSREVVDALLNRIRSIDDNLHAYTSVATELAHEQAGKVDALRAAGNDLGPLHGVPVSLKDNVDLQHVPTTAGSVVLADNIAKDDAHVTRRYKSAGAVILGKLSMYEFAYGDVNPEFPEARNPWNMDLSCGASSSGPASAVSAGLCYGAVGTDTGGSVRLPAAACGIVGFKPTYGLIGRSGVIPASFSLDHVGVLGRTVEDAAIQFQWLRGYDKRDPGSRSTGRIGAVHVPFERGDLSGVRIGVPKAQKSELIDVQVSMRVDEAVRKMEDLGARIVQVELPDHLISRSIMWTVSAVEVAEYHRTAYTAKSDKYAPAVRTLIEGGNFISAVDYLHAQRLRSKIVASYEEVFKTVDALAMPTMGFAAWPLSERTIEIDGESEDLMAALTRYTAVANITGHPSVSVPCGFDSDHRPIGLQIVANSLKDREVLEIAAAYESATDWTRMHPEL